VRKKKKKKIYPTEGGKNPEKMGGQLGHNSGWCVKACNEVPKSPFLREIKIGRERRRKKKEGNWEADYKRIHRRVAPKKKNSTRRARSREGGPSSINPDRRKRSGKEIDGRESIPNPKQDN